MSFLEMIRRVKQKGMNPFNKIRSIFPERSTKVTRDFFDTKPKLK